MFAFALWDRKRGRLVLARDRLGQKPLFYTDTGDAFLFASEVKALLADPRVSRRVCPPALHDFLSFKFIPRHEDLFEGIHEVPTASVLVHDGKDAAIERYWELYFRPDPSFTEEDAMGRAEELLKESVRLRLMSDVPLGALLSSGIDSGLIVAMMDGSPRDPTNTFSIGDRTRGFNELPHARLTAERYGTRHREFVVEPNAVEILPDLVWHLDGPYADIPALPMYYVMQLARRHVTVALTGDGGDESFGGYDRYIANQILSAYRRIPAFVRRHIVPRVLRLFEEKTARKSWRQTLRWMNSMSLIPERESYARGISFFSFENEQKEALYTPEFKRKVGDANALDGLLAPYWSEHAEAPVNRMMYTDLMVRMAKYSNIKVDRISMMYGLEARSPFMDHRLVEFAATIPPRLKMKGRKRKYLLKRIAERHLPESIINLPKQGFGSPINAWLRGELRGLSEGLLKPSRLVRDGFFDPSCIDGLLADHAASRLNNGPKIWTLINLETWYRIYFGDSDPASELGNVKDLFRSLV
jgi:asparagine synthase (glutamine-hydrolysing)